MLFACSSDQPAPKSGDETGSNNLVDKIGQIKNLPYRTISSDTSEIDSIVWTCGDSIYWEIVRLGENVIPSLVAKIVDTTITDIIIPCREDKLSIGAIAFIILDEIVSIPYYLVFGVQWCVYEMDCNFGFPEGLLEFIIEHPQEAYDNLVKWLNMYGNLIQTELLNDTNQTECQKQFGIKHKLSINY